MRSQPPPARAARRDAVSLSLLPAACLLGLLLTLSAGTARGQETDVISLVRQSQFVFLGTIQRVGAATEAEFPVDGRTAVVRVDSVLRSVDQFRVLAGREVTVQLLGDLPAASGDSAVFFTRSWLYGQTLAVVEVGRRGAEQAPAIPHLIAAAEANLGDEKLAARIAASELIVVGTVTATAPAPGNPEGRPRSEHDPDWWEATIAVASVEKGRPPADLRVLFANSTDEMWSESPKLRKGETAVLLLRRDQQEKGMPALRRPGWTALDPLDVQPPARIQRLRTLIGSH